MSAPTSGSVAMGEYPDTTEQHVQRVSCVEPSFCVAVDIEGDVVTSTDPTNPGSWSTFRVPASLSACRVPRRTSASPSALTVWRWSRRIRPVERPLGSKRSSTPFHRGSGLEGGGQLHDGRLLSDESAVRGGGSRWRHRDIGRSKWRRLLWQWFPVASIGGAPYVSVPPRPCVPGCAGNTAITSAGPTGGTSAWSPQRCLAQPNTFVGVGVRATSNARPSTPQGRQSPEQFNGCPLWAWPPPTMVGVIGEHE